AHARVNHHLAKFDLAPVGGDLTRPFIASTGGRDDRVRLLDRVSNGAKRMPHHGLRCDHGGDQNREEVIHGLPSSASARITARLFGRKWPWLSRQSITTTIALLLREPFR